MLAGQQETVDSSLPTDILSADNISRQQGAEYKLKVNWCMRAHSTGHTPVEYKFEGRSVFAGSTFVMSVSTLNRSRRVMKGCKRRC